MKVLFVYKYLTVGGVETVLRSRLDGLEAWGIEAHAWFLADGPGRSLFHGVEDRIRVGEVADFERYIESWIPDIITIIDTEEVFPAIAGLSTDLPIVVEIHSPYRENRIYLHWLGKLPIRAFFVPSDYQASVIRKRVAKIAEVRLVPNPLRENFVAEPTEFSPAPPRPVVAWIGRLDALKNWSEFINIAGVLCKRNDIAEFWIVGHGQGTGADARLYRKAKRSGILGHLRWFKSFPHEHIPVLLDAVRESGGIVISTSRAESFGMTIAEAMSRGCAVVVPAHGPFKEFVTHDRHGHHYKPGSAKDAANQVEMLLSDDRLRNQCGGRAREDILARHSPQRALEVLAYELKRILKTGTIGLGQ